MSCGFPRDLGRLKLPYGFRDPHQTCNDPSCNRIRRWGGHKWIPGCTIQALCENVKHCNEPFRIINSENYRKSELDKYSHQFVVLKFEPGYQPAIHELQQWFMSLYFNFDIKAELEAVLENDFLLVNCFTCEEQDRMLSLSPIFLMDRYAAISPNIPDFDPDKPHEQPIKELMWLSLQHISKVAQIILPKILAPIGEVLQQEETTMDGVFTIRVLVETCLFQTGAVPYVRIPLGRGFTEVVHIEYEDLALRCQRCGEFSHPESECQNLMKCYRCEKFTHRAADCDHGPIIQPPVSYPVQTMDVDRMLE
ncbi:hypothetical protein Mapa_013953 [Marchantia paleacea]|nr:hypothetical protein Mapa_013953 [Marchantia paleacea]